MNDAQLVIYLCFRFLSIFELGPSREIWKLIQAPPLISGQNMGQDLWAPLSDFVYIKRVINKRQ